MFPTQTNCEQAQWPHDLRSLPAQAHSPDAFLKGRVLVVDDDPALAEMLGIVLRGEGFEPSFVADGDKALAAFRDSKPDVVLLDLMLPNKDGLEVCRQIRAESGVPIVMLTAKSDTVDVVLGLESGADDYIVKPFKPKELVARVRARMRRNDDIEPESLRIGEVDIDVAGHRVTRDGQEISLTPLEFDLLVALARKPRQVFTREVLLEQVWGYRHAADTRLVNVHVQRLRAKIERDPERPEIVLTNAPDDRHPDHGRAAELVVQACFYAGLRQIKTTDKDGQSQEAHRPRFVYHFIQDRSLTPDFVVDISPYWDGKIAAIRAYESQFFNPDSPEPQSYISGEPFMKFLEARTREHGHMIGVEFGEGFISKRMLGVSDLFNLV